MRTIKDTVQLWPSLGVLAGTLGPSLRDLAERPESLSAIRRRLENLDVARLAARYRAQRGR